jgi:excisionase family DNA binding protein
VIGRPELAGLVQPDGTFVVPDNLANDVLRRLVRDMHNEARGLGVIATPAAQRLLDGLYEAAERHRRPLAEADPAFAKESESAGSSTVELTVTDTAGRLECSEQWVRQLARRGRITGRRIGRTWLLDAASVESYRTTRG